ncbi:HTH_Tnp_Tc3_2 domain-containing protein [Trichonephila clavipes]|nr:HTH_Tnp_Tc3_2 domain-containing protein [Trichonephila clavipes]
MLLISSLFLIPSFQILNNSKSQTVVRGPKPVVKDYGHRKDITVVANRKLTSTRKISVIAVALGITITVNRSLHLNGLYSWAPRVCISLSVRSIEARLKWCYQHMNWTVSVGGKDVLGNAVCRRFPPPALLRDLDATLHEE